MRFLLYSLVDVLSAAVVAVPLVWLFQRFRGERGWTRYVLSGLFVLYLCEMFDVVGIPAAQYIHWEPNLSLIPFSDGTGWLGVQRVLNAVMFAPLGFLLPVLWRKCRKWSVATLTGFLLSLTIEVLQMFCFRATDVDDLLMNTLGALLGYFLAWLFFHKKWARDSAPGTFKVSDTLSLAVTILIPLLTIVFIRTPISDCIYRLPLFD